MTRNVTELIKIYSETVFELMSPLSELPNPFAIITAYNPQSKNFSESNNIIENQALEEDLSQVFHLPVNGRSLDASHQEPSFAVQISKAAAIGLAEKYNQNAIFWVDGDDLHIVPVLMDGDEVSVGSFRNRIQANPKP